VRTFFGESAYQGLTEQLKLTLPGFRYTDGYFVHIDQQGLYWTQSSFDKRRAWYYGISAKNRKVSRDYMPNTDALACRCVRDDQ
ncbi:MAG: hypothetical protein AAFP19_04710, partial [Bacteroidota bacterium]